MKILLCLAFLALVATVYGGVVSYSGYGLGYSSPIISSRIGLGGAYYGGLGLRSYGLGTYGLGFRTPLAYTGHAARAYAPISYGYGLGGYRIGHGLSYF